MIEDLETNILSSLSSQLDTLQIKKNKEEVEQDLAIFFQNAEQSTHGNNVQWTKLRFVEYVVRNMLHVSIHPYWDFKISIRMMRNQNKFALFLINDDDNLYLKVQFKTNISILIHIGLTLPCSILLSHGLFQHKHGWILFLQVSYGNKGGEIPL
jgi:hypothetical protein